MKRTILVRGVDEEAYRKAKAAAALKGVPLGAAVSEALDEWSRRPMEGVEQEVEKDREFVKNSWARIAKQRGKAVVVSSGKLQGVFDTYDQASEFASKFRVALTFVVDAPPQEHALEIGPDMEL